MTPSIDGSHPSAEWKGLEILFQKGELVPTMSLSSSTSTLNADLQNIFTEHDISKLKNVLHDYR
jgi:hypothetical protein